MSIELIGFTIIVMFSVFFLIDSGVILLYNETKNNSKKRKIPEGWI